MNSFNCPRCGKDLSESTIRSKTQGDSYINAIKRARKRLMKETGYGVKMNLKKLLNNLPKVKASKYFMENLNRRIDKYESKVKQGKGEKTSKSSKR